MGDGRRLWPGAAAVDSARGGERCQMMMWPYCLAMGGIVISAVGWVCNWWVGSGPWVNAMLLIGMVLACLAGVGIYWDRDRIRRLEIEELRSEIQALRDRL